MRNQGRHQGRKQKTEKSLRIAIAQINTTLGNFPENGQKILDWIRRAKDRHCDLVAFPESTLFGYHPFDLLEREKLVDDQLKQIRIIEKSVPAGVAALVGVFTKNPNKRGRPYFNSVALIQKGKKTRYFHKQLLPTGDVFDEARFIAEGDMSRNFFAIKGKKIFLTICEDIWAWPTEEKKSQYVINPIQSLQGKKVDLVVNMSASPFFPGKDGIRKQLVRKVAKAMNAPMIYANLVGGQDEIVFDGNSFALDSKGKTLMQCLSFEEDLGLFDLGKMEGSSTANPLPPSEAIRQALVLGIKDFCRKVGIQKVHLGLSGGVDSALVACLAVDALGPSAVQAFALPSQFNAPESLELAKTLAKNLGIRIKEIPIQKIFEVASSTVDEALEISEFGLVHENLQARIRGMLLMAYSNRAQSLLLATSNKSELAAGYSTLYGDLCGGLAPIGDLTKSQVYELCGLYNSERMVIPDRILTRAPSAELRENQKDQDSLPPYEDLDKSVQRLVRDCRAVSNPVDQWLLGVLMKSEFKRWQAPPILKVSQHSFGRGRRYPIAHQARETRSKD